MAPSQLSQLKSALNSAGLSRTNHSKKEKKAYKKGGARETDRAKKLDKLEEIRRNLNKFDERETKVKHDVGGRNLKGVIGRPSASKQAGLEQRKKTLLPEHQLRDHTGTFRDRRFGEADPTLSIEDRMLERYTRERQRGQGKKGLFNIEDEGETLDIFDDGFAMGGLTHGGRSVLDLPGDDFEAQGYGERDDDDDRGRIDKRVVSRGHFGGFNGEEEEDQEELPEKKKSKQEVMAEVIAKSKEHKYERQQQKELDDELRDELDTELDDLRALLAGDAPRRPAASNFASTSRQAAAAAPAQEDGDYDQIVRTLAFDSRAKPKNRTKTEEELALEEKEKLEKAEAKRIRRMRGDSVSDDEDGEVSRKRRKMDAKKPDADDLDDDFVEDEDELLGPGLTREGIEAMALPEDEDAESGEEDEDEDEEEGSDDEDEADEEEDEEEEDDSEAESAMDDLNSEEGSDVDGSDEELESVVKRSKTKSSKTAGKVKEIPYTFICPSSIEEFEDILEPLEESALPIVVQRIRALHHPSLAAGNKEKLQDFLGVLIDYILILSSQRSPPFDLVSSLVPHVIALVKLNPVTAAGHFVEKLKLMQKNLARGLARGPSRPDSKTFPGCPELVLLRLVGTVWSTSDFSHPVVAPAVLLMGQYLGQSRVRSVADLASGLFLGSLLAQYESLSKRLLPEAVNFVASTILTLLPRRKGFEQNSTYPDVKAAGIDLFVSPTAAAVPSETTNLAAAINAKSDDVEQQKVNLLAVAFRLTETFATMFASSEAFIELMQPVAKVVEGSRVAKLSPELKAIHTKAFTTLTRMLTHARKSRQPLTLQAHKPIPIASYAPRFEENFAPDRHYDPDVERNATNKLKSMYKKERKGAIRELRKDNKFLAGERAREQAEKDAKYNQKMKTVEGAIQGERAEEKAMQREKARDKRRAGK
ncbi:hypothetical protein CI109_100341 [Kwoniella shandongensis]|uniref:Uncharacterized protein n=1 Tax=Kwoniella shandongensis TaxID=1734106 RepID=A0A5M6C4H3_9TREE|nr:uncharacterized protein CI109_001813 [Kwoniella shandongensis]KAA5529873.1 hypothetical protein CI109_001813 [Kwoniella shandongensis]